MSISVLANDIVAAAGDETPVESMETEFLPGRTVAAHIHCSGMSGTFPSVKIQGSNTSATTGFVDLLEVANLDGYKVDNVVAYRWMRANVITAAGTLAGRYTA